eukprot:174847-Prorocentrum_minimum.AAC.2
MAQAMISKVSKWSIRDLTKCLLTVPDVVLRLLAQILGYTTRQQVARDYLMRPFGTSQGAFLRTARAIIEASARLTSSHFGSRCASVRVENTIPRLNCCKIWNGSGRQLSASIMITR